MGTTAQKLQKLVDNKQLIVDKVNAKAGTAFTINSKPSDIANAISDITSGGGIPEGYIKPSGNKEITENGDYDITSFASVSVNVPTTGGGSTGGTAVPNSGMVEKVYLNTSLSKEEVMSIIESANLTYIDNTYTIFLSSDYTSYLLIKINSFGVYHIWFGEDILWTDISGWNDFVNPLVINKENSVSSMGVGTQNDLIKDIISSTPFSGSCEPTGLPLEVDSLPSGGTAVPNTGYVEKVYVNTSMSKEEVVSLLNNVAPEGVAFILASSDMSTMFAAMKDNTTVNDEEVSYWSIMLMTADGQATLFNEIDVDTFVGWNPHLTEYIRNGIVFNVETTNEVEGMQVGTHNDKLANLFSTTPFGGSAGVEGAIYKIPSKFIDLFIASDYGFGPLSETYNVVGCEEVETLPTSNIVSSTMESFYFYYDKSSNDIYVYINIGNGDMWVDAGTLIQQAIEVSLTFKGTGVYQTDFVEDGYYAQYSGDKYYIYLNNKFIEVAEEQKTIQKFINEERFDRLEINYTTNNNLNLGGKFEDFKGDYIKINVTPYCFWDGVFELGSYVFADATVKTVYFNALCEGALEIDDTTFVDATNLEKVILNFTDFKEIINDSNNYNGFKNTPIANGTGYIYVPDNKVDYVKSLNGWSTYASQIRPLSKYVE